jgi:hypothetical protein
MPQSVLVGDGGDNSILCEYIGNAQNECRFLLGIHYWTQKGRRGYECLVGLELAKEPKEDFYFWYFFFVDSAGRFLCVARHASKNLAKSMKL